MNKIVIPFLNQTVKQPYWVFQKFVLEIRRISDQESFPNTLLVLSAERSNVEFKECHESISDLYTNLIYDNKARFNKISEGELNSRLAKFRIDREDYEKRLLKAKIVWKGLVAEKEELDNNNVYKYDVEKKCFVCE